MFTVDFALTEAAYAVVRIIQRFHTIKLPDDVTVELTGAWQGGLIGEQLY